MVYLLQFKHRSQEQKRSETIRIRSSKNLLLHKIRKKLAKVFIIDFFRNLIVNQRLKPLQKPMEQEKMADSW